MPPLVITLAPVGVILLVASVVGVFMLPAIALLLAVLSLDGFLAVCARIGAVLRGVKGRGPDASPLFLFTSGLLGLFLLKLPSLCGIFLTLFSAPAASTAGEILRVTSLAAMAAALRVRPAHSGAHGKAHFPNRTGMQPPLPPGSSHGGSRLP